MKAITVDDLKEWFESQQVAAAHRYDVPTDADMYYAEMGAAFERQEAEYVASLTAQQRLDYMVANGELAHCPTCGTRYADVVDEEFADMVGTTFVTTYECCGYTDSCNDALEYRDGKVVDVR